MPSIMDIFSGCGGLSLGAHQAGFSTALAIDADPLLSSSFSMNFPQAQHLLGDIRDLNKTVLEKFLPRGVDGIVGGPPCQAFSEMGRRAPDDPRRELVREYFRIVGLVRPKFFLFENVRGLGFPENRDLLDDGLGMLPSSWSIIGPQILNAADFGAPTRRLRLFVIGFDRNRLSSPTEEEMFATPKIAVNVRDAIADLQSASPLGEYESGFDVWKYDGRRAVSDYAAHMRSSSGKFTGHRKTCHTQETLRRFEKLRPGHSDKIGKYPRLSWDGLCPTLRAGTGSERGSYQAVRPVHPSEDRVITPREAARLQGFPDDFLFHPTVWHSCRMIGNSVSPIIARALLKRIAVVLGSSYANASSLQAAE